MCQQTFLPISFPYPDLLHCVESLCAAGATTTSNQASNCQCGVFTYKHPRKCVAEREESGRIISASPSPRKRWSPAYGGESKTRSYFPKRKKSKEAHSADHLFRARKVLLDVRVLPLAGVQSSQVKDWGVLLYWHSPSSCRIVLRSVAMVVLLFEHRYLIGRSAHLNSPSQSQNSFFWRLLVQTRNNCEPGGQIMIKWLIEWSLRKP